MEIQEQQLIDPEMDLELKIEDTRKELLVSILKGSAKGCLLPSLVSRRAERIADRAIEYIYYEDDEM